MASELRNFRVRVLPSDLFYFGQPPLRVAEVRLFADKRKVKLAPSYKRRHLVEIVNIPHKQLSLKKRKRNRDLRFMRIFLRDYKNTDSSDHFASPLITVSEYLAKEHRGPKSKSDHIEHSETLVQLKLYNTIP